MSQGDLFGGPEPSPKKEAPRAKLAAPKRSAPPEKDRPLRVGVPRHDGVPPHTGPAYVHNGLPPRDDWFGPGHRVTCPLHGAGRVGELYPSGLIQVQFGTRHWLYHRDGVLEGRWPTNEDMTLSHA